MSSSHFLDPYVLYLVGKNKSILDLGCGIGKWGFLLKEGYQEPKMIVGADLWLPYLRRAKSHNIYDDLVLSDVRKLPFRNKCFQVALGCEVIEHMVVREGFNMINEAERVATEKVIVSTPNVKDTIELQAKALESWEKTHGPDDPFQLHKSIWKASGLKKLGFKVYGIGFRGMSRFHPVWLMIGLSPAALLMPQLGAFLLAEKKLKV